MIAFFQKVEDEINDAYESNDVEKISQLLSSDWIILESTTGISDKSQFLKAIEEGRLSHSSMKKEVVDVRRHGDVAIVVTRGKNIGHYKDAEFNSEQWITNIYHYVDSHWSCIMTQEIAVGC